jgi:hypothetical protein
MQTLQRQGHNLAGPEGSFVLWPDYLETEQNCWVELGQDDGIGKVTIAVTHGTGLPGSPGLTATQPLVKEE